MTAALQQTNVNFEEFESDFNIANSYNLPSITNRQTLSSITKEYKVSFPESLGKLRTTAGWDNATIAYYRQGYGKKVGGLMDEVVPQLVYQAKIAQDINTKTFYAMYVSYLVIQAHQPLNTITLFDNSLFKNSDLSGWAFCLKNKNKDLPRRCEYSLHGFWSRLLEDIQISDLVKRTEHPEWSMKLIKDIIEDSANQAPYVYALRPSSGISNVYFNGSKKLSLEQGQKAAAQVAFYLEYIFN
ncbi:hypothetical protein EIJ81_00930 (plasmid) [Aliivibrio salmonicida]|nr:hypothetical protein [Aliivibrio salmonicida]AZL83464.1 hypothetical protein EIJ81_00930 [Aliivibrio salmonicida]